MTPERWFVWGYRYGCLEIHPQDSLEEALRFAYSLDTGDEGVLHAIEGPDGIVSDEVWDIFAEAKRAAERASAQTSEPSTHRVDVLSPSPRAAWATEDWGAFDFHPNEADAKAQADNLRLIFGADRVRVTALRLGARS